MVEELRRSRSGPALWRFVLTDFLVTLARAWWHSLAAPFSKGASPETGGFLRGAGHDVRYAVRGLIRSPVFTVVATLTLVIGIGANTAIFSLIHQLVLKPLPYPDQDQLVVVWATDEQSGREGIQVSYGDMMDIAEQNEVFSDVGVISRNALTLGSSDGPVRVTTRGVSRGFFRALGVNAALGRTFVDDDFVRSDSAPSYVTLMSHGLWTTLGADPAIVGQSITVNGSPVEVIGVLPAGFDFEFPSAGVQLWFPLVLSQEMRHNRSFYGFEAIARLRPGVTLPQARANLAGIGDQLEEDFLETNANRGFTVVPLQQEVVGDTKGMLVLLMGVVVLVLLIGCANVANLMLSRLTARRQELAVRTALGARPGRLVRQLLTEALVLSTVGAVLGVAAAWIGIDAIAAGSDDPRVNAVGLEWPVMLFATGVTLLTSLIFGAVPGWIVSRTRPAVALHSGTRGSEGDNNRLRQGLAVAQVAVALTLLVGAGLLVSSVRQALAADTGFDRSRVLTFRVSLPPDKYPDRFAATAWYTMMAEELTALPGVEAVGVTNSIPLSGSFGSAWFTVEGRPTPVGETPPDVGYNRVMPGYFEAMGIPLLQGRSFSQADVDQDRHVTVISQSVARQIFGDESPLGRRIELGAPSGDWHEIIGVVGDTRSRGLVAEVRPEAYDLMGPHWSRSNSVAIRATGDPALLAESVRRVVTRLEDRAPVYSIATMDQLAADRLEDERSMMSLVGGFALVALVLATVGLYGVLAYGVSRRTREIGIRLALGGQRNDVVGMVVGQGMRLIAVGLLLGLVMALALTRLIESLLFGVSPMDPLTFGMSAAAMCLVGLAASWYPALRAGRVDPVIAIRED